LPGFSGLLGASGHDLPRRLLLSGQVQGLVAFGARLGQMTTCGWHVDLRPGKIAAVDSTERTYFPAWAPDLKAVGPMDRVCRALAEGLKKSEHQEKPEFCEHLQGAKGNRTAFIAALAGALPQDAWLFTESIYDGVGAELAASGLRFECSTNLGGIGCAVPTGIGAQSADPARCVVSITGDGGFLMNGLELLTAVRYRIPMLTLVFRDGLLGAVRAAFDRHRVARREVTECPGPEFMPFLHSMGVRAVEVSSPESVEAHVTRWASTAPDRRPSVIVIDER
jgi:acetolactate synthase-1/2/3 large subunit